MIGLGAISWHNVIAENDEGMLLSFKAEFSNRINGGMKKTTSLSSKQRRTKLTRSQLDSFYSSRFKSGPHLLIGQLGPDPEAR